MIAVYDPEAFTKAKEGAFRAIYAQLKVTEEHFRWQTLSRLVDRALKQEPQETVRPRRHGKRRGRGGCCVYRRRDGRWEARLWIPQDSGRKRVAFYGNSQAEVNEQLLEARFGDSRGLPVAPQWQTVQQFLNRWLEDSIKPSVRLATYQQYHQHVRLYLGPGLGRYELAKLLPEHVEAFVNARVKAGLSARIVELSLVILRHALKTAMERSLVIRNVAKLVKRPKARKRTML